MILGDFFGFELFLLDSFDDGFVVFIFCSRGEDFLQRGDVFFLRPGLVEGSEHVSV